MAELTELLSEIALARLRAAYVRGAMLGAAKGAAGRRWPAAAAWGNVVADDVYDSPHQAAADRERCVIALQVANDHPLGLALHTYWGLMEGLTVADIAQTVLVAGTYSGLDAYIRGAECVATTLTVLAQVAGADERDCSPPQVVAGLREAIR